jgi:tetratricopeptide (TPR) repeat protein
LARRGGVTKKSVFLLFLIIPLLLLVWVQESGAQSEILRQFSQALEKESEGDCTAAIFIYQDILKQNPYFLEAKIGLSRCYFETGNLTLSESIIREALQQEKRNVEALNLLGRIYTSMKRYDEAEEIFTRAIEIEPTRYETKYRLADLYRARGDYLRAVKLYNEIVKVYPQEVKTYIYLGIVYTELGELQKAGGFYRKAVSLDSHDPLTHLNLSRHYYRMGVKHSRTDPEDADEYFDAGIYEAKTALAIHNRLPPAHEITGAIHFYRKDYAAAIDAYKKLLEYKDTYLIHYELGFCYEMFGNYEQALEYYRTALRKRIDDEIIRFRLENLLLRLYRMNLTHKERIEHSDYHFTKGNFLLDKNFMDKAYLHYKRAIMLDPTNPQKRLALADLFRIRKYYEQYLFELRNIIHDTLDVDTIDINDRIEIYQSRVEKNLAARWRVGQYEEDEESLFFFPKTKTRIGIFNGFSSDYIRENFLHRELSKSLSDMLALVLTFYPKIEVVSSSKELFSERDALREARALGVDYYVIGEVE